MISNKSIILPSLRGTLNLIDDTCNLIVERCYPLDIDTFRFTLIGTFNGVVLLAWSEYYLILYNPLTGASKHLPRPPGGYHLDACGFGYGATPDDLKIVWLKKISGTCNVYTFREGSWSTIWRLSKRVEFEYNVGHFVNGFLYWIAYHRSVLIAINVKDISLSEICLPFTIATRLYVNPLGTVDGYLCSLQPRSTSGFDMWVMKEENQWSKLYSFELVGLPLHDIFPYYAMCILDSRRVLMWSRSSTNLIIYDASKGSHKALNISIKGHIVNRVRALEYVETLVSPSDMCFERRRKRKRKGDKSRK